MRPALLEKALDILQGLGNPHYKNILRLARDHSELLPTIYESDEEDNCDDINMSDDDKVSDSSDNSDSNTSVTPESPQSKNNFATCMMPEAPESAILFNNTSVQITEGPITLAPGEGKVPTSFVRDDDYEAKCFPTKFPTG